MFSFLANLKKNLVHFSKFRFSWLFEIFFAFFIFDKKVTLYLAVATVTGIIDGTGSVGAAVGQIAIPIMEENIGWDSVFVMFMVMSGLSALALTFVVYRELKDVWCARCRPSNEIVLEARESDEILNVNA
jgi:nitrate/nitrite transporter NarK